MALVVIADLIHDAGIRPIQGANTVVTLWQNDGDIPPDTEVLVVRTTLVSRNALERLPQLRLVVKHGAGYDNIDVDACTEHGVLVCNTPGVGAQAVAEHAVALIAACAKRLLPLDAGLRQGDYAARDRVRTLELRGRTAGIVGLGNIGRRVAHILQGGFDMTILGFDAFLDADVMIDGITRIGNLEELVENSDVMSLHVPLTPQTRNLIDERVLGLARPHAILVNTARGGIIDEEALARALTTGVIGAAGLDVFESEPPHPEHPLWQLDNAIVTPHIAGLTEDTAAHMALAVADIVAGYAAGQPLPTALNPERRGVRS